jgi:hypothetical protein
MSDIPRYRMDLYEGESSNKGLWVRHEDHVAAVEAAVLAERDRCHEIVASLHVDGMALECYTEEVCERISNAQVSVIGGALTPPAVTRGCPGGYAKVAEVPTSARPERKFKIGNQVTHRDSKKVRKIKNYYFSSENDEWKYDIGFYYVESELTLYVPPTPAELIPTLKEHEWVRFKAWSGKWKGPYAIYPNSSHDSILLSAGGYSLLFSDGTTSTAA